MQLQFKHYMLKSLIRRRKALRLPIFLCSMTIAVIFFISILYSTIQNTIYEENKAAYGSWTIAVYNTSPKSLMGLQKNVLVDQLGKMTICGEITNLYVGKNNYIGAIDDAAYSLTCISFEQGRYPKNSSEIALEKELLLELGIPDTLGSTVELYYTDAEHNKKQASFTLCGIINPYHNNYLRQGPLVNAFVSTDYRDLLQDPLSINTFVSLKKEYANEDIFHELSAPFRTSEGDPKEQWYYNSYVETSKQIMVTTIFVMIAIGAIMLTSTYLSFYKYYVHRFNTLLASQVLNLDKKKIMHIFREESRIILPLYTVFGCLLGSAGTFLLYHIVKYVYHPIHFYIDWRFLLIAVALTVPCLLVTITTSRLHSHYIIMRKPVLHLPAVPMPLCSKKYKRFFFVINRFAHVYKKSLLYHIILHTIGISSLLFMVTTGYYTYDCMKLLNTTDRTDYSIEKVKNVQDFAGKFSQIKRLSEVDSVSHSEYVEIGDIILISVPDTSIAPFNHNCYVNVQPNVSNETIGIHDNQLHLRTDTGSYILNIQNYSEYNWPDGSNPLSPNNHTLAYCNQYQYKDIITSLNLTSYNYVTINYTKNCNPNVVTNIIDRILMDEEDINLVHNYLVIDKTCLFLFTNGGILALLCLFSYLISFIISRNHQRASLQYLKKELKIFWCLGLSKSTIHWYTLALNLLWAIVTIPLCLLLTMCFNQYLLTSYPLLIQYRLIDFVVKPEVVGLISCSLLLYLVVYLSYLHHDIKQSLNNLYNLT